MASYEVVLANSFKRCVKRLKKRFPQISQDVTEVVRDLVENPGQGVVIPGGSGTRKIRVRNRDAGKGKLSPHLLCSRSSPTNCLLTFTLC